MPTQNEETANADYEQLYYKYKLKYIMLKEQAAKSNDKQLGGATNKFNVYKQIGGWDCKKDGHNWKLKTSGQCNYGSHQSYYCNYCSETKQDNSCGHH
jgi:hypothetical protein